MYYVNPIIKNMFRTKQGEGRGGYIRLDQNENPDGIPKWLFDSVMSEITPEYLSLYPEEEIFIHKYAALLGVDDKQVTLTDGSVVAMSYVIKVFGEPGKNLVCVTPTFGMYKVYADLQGMDTIFVHYEDDYAFDIDKLIAQIDDNTSIVSLVNPNMPIGNSYTDNEIVRVLEKAKQHNAMVIVDEAYHYFYDGTSIPYLEKYDNLVILRTFSKMLSMPGLRLGMIISSKANIQYIINYKPHYTINGVALLFAERMVDNYERVMKELKEKFFCGKTFLLDALEKAQYSYLPTDGCFVCITPKKKSAEEITEELKKRNILIFCGKGDSKGFLRVTIWDKKYMDMFMKALEEIDR